MGKVIGAMVMIGLIALIIYGISQLGAGLTGPLGALVVWLGQQWPGSPEYAPYFVLLTLFLSFHLLLTPYYLKLAHYGRGSNDPGKASNKRSELENRMMGIAVLLAAGDGVFLFLLVRTVQGELGYWAAAAGKLMNPPTGFLALCLLLPGLFIGDILTTMLSVHISRKLFTALAEQTGLAAPEKHDAEAAGLEAGVQEILVYNPIFIGLWVAYPKSKVLFTMIACLLLTKVVARGFFEFVSLLADRRRG